MVSQACLAYLSCEHPHTNACNRNVKGLLAGVSRGTFYVRLSRRRYATWSRMPRSTRTNPGTAALASAADISCIEICSRIRLSRETWSIIIKVSAILDDQRVWSSCTRAGREDALQRPSSAMEARNCRDSCVRPRCFLQRTVLSPFATSMWLTLELAPHPPPLPSFCTTHPRTNPQRHRTYCTRFSTRSIHVRKYPYSRYHPF